MLGSGFSSFSSNILWGRHQVSHFPIARGTSPHLLVHVAIEQSQFPWLEPLSHPAPAWAAESLSPGAGLTVTCSAQDHLSLIVLQILYGKSI